MTEHLARYRMARTHAAHKRVLDVCCGVGYGSAMIGQVAREVVGFDRDVEAIEYAREHYASDHVCFEVSDVFDWQGRDFDLVVAFEALEHVYDVGAFFAQLYRNCRSLGSVLLSTPTYDNCKLSPFHVKCLTRFELEHYLGEWFKGELWGQKSDEIRSDLEDPDYWICIGRPQ